MAHGNTIVTGSPTFGLSKWEKMMSDNFLITHMWPKSKTVALMYKRSICQHFRLAIYFTASCSFWKWMPCRLSQHTDSPKRPYQNGYKRTKSPRVSVIHQIKHFTQSALYTGHLSCGWVSVTEHRAEAYWVHYYRSTWSSGTRQCHLN